MKCKITIKTATEWDQYGSRMTIACVYEPECASFEEAMRKARYYAIRQCDDEHCDGILSVEVTRYEEDA